jgi:hypothetical protein
MVRVGRYLVVASLCFVSAAGSSRERPAYQKGCAPSDDLVANLTLASADPGKVESVQRQVSVSPRWSLVFSGRCANDLTGSRAGYFKLRSGASVELSKPVQDPAVGLRRSVGRTMVDAAESIDIPAGLRNSSNGRLISLTSGLSPGATINRYTAVWSRRKGSLIGFVDIDRASGRHVAHPLFTVPLQVRSAYYLASPDTNYGEITILGPVAGGTKVITVGVAM